MLQAHPEFVVLRLRSCPNPKLAGSAPSHGSDSRAGKKKGRRNAAHGPSRICSGYRRRQLSPSVSSSSNVYLTLARNMSSQLCSDQ